MIIFLKTDIIIDVLLILNSDFCGIVSSFFFFFSFMFLVHPSFNFSFFFSSWRRRLKKLNCLTLLFNDLSLEREVASFSGLTEANRVINTVVCLHERAETTTMCACVCLQMNSLYCILVPVPPFRGKGFTPVNKLRSCDLRHSFHRPDARL